MSQNNLSLGLTSIQYGALASDGGPATTFVQIPNSVIDSPVFKSTAPQINQIFTEESSIALTSVVATDGSFEVDWSTYDVDQVWMAVLFGGTFVTGTKLYTQASQFPIVEQTLEVTTPTGHVLTFNRSRLIGTLTWNFTKSKPAQIDVVADVLAPAKSGVAPFTILYPNAA